MSADVVPMFQPRIGVTGVDGAWTVGVVVGDRVVVAQSHLTRRFDSLEKARAYADELAAVHGLEVFQLPWRDGGTTGSAAEITPFANASHVVEIVGFSSLWLVNIEPRGAYRELSSCFASRAEALEYARGVGEAHGWPVRFYVPKGGGA